MVASSTLFQQCRRRSSPPGAARRRPSPRSRRTRSAAHSISQILTIRSRSRSATPALISFTSSASAPRSGVPSMPRKIHPVADMWPWSAIDSGEADSSDRRWCSDKGLCWTAIHTRLSACLSLDSTWKRSRRPCTRRPDVWLPLQLEPSSSSDLNFLLAAARLRDGVSFEAARAETALTADVVRRALPAVMPADSGLTIDHLQASLVRDVRPSLLLIASMVAFVLLIACVNTMNLLLVRASGREREIAIRLATGAGRGRIVRQLLTEGIALAVAGGGVGLALGAVGTRLLSSIRGWNLPRIGSGVSAAPMDPHVLAVTLAISMAAGIAFGLVPAYRAVRDDLGSGLTSSSRNRRRRAAHPRALLVLISGGARARALIGFRVAHPQLRRTSRCQSGFDARDVVTMESALLDSPASQPQVSDGCG